MSAQVRHANCIRVYGLLIDLIRERLAEGDSLARVADRLNAMGHVTTYGNPFKAMAVYRILKMFKSSGRSRPVVRCNRCDREVTVSWKERETREAYDLPFVCADCARDTQPSQCTALVALATERSSTYLAAERVDPLELHRVPC